MLEVRGGSTKTEKIRSDFIRGRGQKSREAAAGARQGASTARGGRRVAARPEQGHTAHIRISRGRRAAFTKDWETDT